MVDLKSQYKKIKRPINKAVLDVISSTQYIGGEQLKIFTEKLAAYLGSKHVIPCANGTDALQIAFMALGLEPGDEVIVPAFTYVATAEVIALLRLTPVMVDVDPKTMNLTAKGIEKAISSRTKAIVPVHLFGQCCDMEPILALAKKHNLFVIEDNAQAIGADYTFADGSKKKAGTMGQIGCTSFFPSKNLGCFGDGGAMFTDDDALAARLRMIANHGQSHRYYHDEIGVNSRLDNIQAAVLNIKLDWLDRFNKARQKAARNYDRAFKHIPGLKTPARQRNSTHVFHQYTLMVDGGRRDELQQFLTEKGVPSMIYYPVPLYDQKAFSPFYNGKKLAVTEALCQSVISLPMHTELTADIQSQIVAAVVEFFKN